MVLVGGYSGLFEFGIGLVKQLFGLGGMAAQVEFIRLLRIGYAPIGLIDQMLRGGQVRVSFGADIMFRLLGGGGNGKTGGHND